MTDVTLYLRKNSKRFQRKASMLLYIEADDQSCTLYFKNEEHFFSGYNLKYYEEKLFCTEAFVRAQRSFLIMLSETENYKYHLALMSNGKKIPLNENSYRVVKEYIDHRNSIPPATAA